MRALRWEGKTAGEVLVVCDPASGVQRMWQTLRVRRGGASAQGGTQRAAVSGKGRLHWLYSGARAGPFSHRPHRTGQRPRRGRAV